MSHAPSLRIVFAGTPDFAADLLLELLIGKDSPHKIVAVYSQPDRPAGRGKKLKPSPVKKVALEHNICVFQPINFKSAETREELIDLKADLMIVVAYGLLLPQSVLDIPKYGCINVHASLLPRWRGAAPIQRAVEAGDKETGVTIMQMDKGLDTGDMLLKAKCEIEPTDTSGDIFDKLAVCGAPALIKTVNLIANGQVSPEAQNSTLSNYAAKISKQEAFIDWHLDAQKIERKIRAFNPLPIAHTVLNGERIKVWRGDVSTQEGEPGTIIELSKKHILVACGSGSLYLRQLQLPGGKAMDIAALMNSKAYMFSVGSQFDSPASQVNEGIEPHIINSSEPNQQ